MKRSFPYLVFIASIVIGVGALFLPFSSPHKQENKQQTYRDKKRKNDAIVHTTKAAKKQEKVVESTPVEEQMKQRLAVVAMKFEETIAYPPYSQPLSQKRKDLLYPNTFFPSHLKLAQGLSTSIRMSKYRYFKPEVISLKLSLRSDDDVNTYQLEKLQLMSDHKVVGDFSVQKQKVDDNTIYYSGHYSDTKVLESDLAQKLYVRAEFTDKENKVYSASSAFEYVEKVAELIDVDESFVDENELKIPLIIDAYKEGTYLVKANLFDEKGEPIAHLYSQKEFKEGKNSIALAAHASVLRAKNAPGPYTLKTFEIIKLIMSREDKRGYGSNEKEDYKVKGFDLEKYTNEPYTNSQSQERLAFLKKISQ